MDKGNDPLCLFWFENREYWFNGTLETDQKVIEFASKYFNFENLKLVLFVNYFLIESIDLQLLN